MQELLERCEVEDLVANGLAAVYGVLLSDFLAFDGLLGAASLDGEEGSANCAEMWWTGRQDSGCVGAYLNWCHDEMRFGRSQRS